ncbi:MAG: hypothetical protein CSA97_01295 [Bacteroidetes bacterium]|nr:MAG: hypothetical protein CSA97_01295 [Bacteroidota bacterium]
MGEKIYQIHWSIRSKKMQPLTIEEVKTVEVEILDYIVDICQQHGLTYYLAYGTLLGAVRHKGFIPWDDDIDIYMPTESYNRMVELATKIETERFRLFIPGEKDYYYPFIKVIDKRTQVEEPLVDPIPGLGLWIDIFPIDGQPKYPNLIIRLLLLLFKMRVVAVHNGMPQMPTWKKAIAWPLWKASRIIGYKPLLSSYIKWTRVKDFNGSKVVTSIEELQYSFPHHIFKNPTEIEFEGRLLDAPNDVHAYLSTVYGEDYMTPPPKHKRPKHFTQAFWR